ncbi:hypothetical protein WA1_07530 [Scytonema hofmannii PCC 7110]|uniref:Uncharacterized protein n=1 Tax=Scytonema hofmannii PCC 7110 TaxID=128403 RepID=A0A139WT76_9CYAN|nr:hypothetical protein [Scytonema hofmannii]KYC35655.1 hypothetical protein WA1_07530 [Scytonema hofmannii PCC 7110]
MKSLKYSITLLVWSLTIIATIQESFAMKIIPSQPGATQYWRQSSDYPTPPSISPPFRNTVEVDTRLWTQPLPLGGSRSFSTTLTIWSLFSERGLFGWDFQPSQQALTGSFIVEDYLACGYEDVCGGERPYDRNFEPSTNGIGANFRLRYDPAPTVPPPGEKTHWIQVARASYAGVFGNPFFIPNIWFVDNFLQRDTPYADEVSLAVTPTLFRDMPYVDGDEYPGVLANNNYFEAQLYFVKETTPPSSRQKKVVIYDGIQWGWKNIKGYKEQDPPPPPCNGGSGGGGCLRTSAVNSTKDQKLLSDKDNKSASHLSVPESTSVMGLLALAAWGVMKALKIRKDKQS